MDLCLFATACCETTGQLCSFSCANTCCATQRYSKRHLLQVHEELRGNLAYTQQPHNRWRSYWRQEGLECTAALLAQALTWCTEHALARLADLEVKGISGGSSSSMDGNVSEACDKEGCAAEGWHEALLGAVAALGTLCRALACQVVAPGYEVPLRGLKSRLMMNVRMSAVGVV